MKQWNNVTILSLLFFPTSFFFGALYTESLFFLLVVLTFYFLKKEKNIFAGSFAFFAALTKLAGVFLFIPFVISFLSSKKDLSFKIYYLISATLPFFGLLIYMYYLYISTGDPLVFFHSQTVFGPARSTKLILLPQVYFRYFKIILTAKPNFQYFISLFELTVFSFVFCILLYELYRLYRLYRLKKPISDQLSLTLFSLSILLLSTLTGSFMSIPRFVLLSLSFFVFLGSIKNVWLTRGLLILFLIFHILVLAFFIQGYFIS